MLSPEKSGLYLTSSRIIQKHFEVIFLVKGKPFMGSFFFRIHVNSIYTSSYVQTTPLRLLGA